MSGDDPYDLDKLKVPPEAISERAAGSTPKRIRKRQQQFAKVPRTWVDALTPNSVDKIWAVVWHLLHEYWKGGGRPIKMPNGMLETDGISRYAKSRALKRLEKLGLITVERTPDKTPIVTIIDPEVSS